MMHCDKRKHSLVFDLNSKYFLKSAQYPALVMLLSSSSSEFNFLIQLLLLLLRLRFTLQSATVQPREHAARAAAMMRSLSDWREHFHLAVFNLFSMFWNKPLRSVVSMSK
jgi:hypothetical protein